MIDLKVEEYGFLALVVALVMGIRFSLRRGGVGFKHVLLVQSTLVLWLLITGALGVSRVLADFKSTPPPLMLLVGLAILGLALMAAIPKFRIFFLDPFPERAAVWLQTFRVGVEILLYRMAIKGYVPEILSFPAGGVTHGRNFDLLVGASAPLIAVFAFRERAGVEPVLLKKVRIVWNSLGLVILANVVIHGILSAPTSFQVLFTTPSNAMIGQFPFCWLPTFLVPCAIYLHLVSLRACLK